MEFLMTTLAKQTFVLSSNHFSSFPPPLVVVNTEDPQDWEWV